VQSRLLKHISHRCIEGHNANAKGLASKAQGKVTDFSFKAKTNTKELL